MIQNNKKGEKPTLTPEEQDTPITPEEEERLDTEGSDPIPEDEILEDPNNPRDEDEEIEGEGEPPAEEPETPTPPTPPTPAKPTPTDAERLREQRREAELLNEQRKQIVTAAEDAEKVAEPTEDELKAYAKEMGATEWDELSTLEKSLLRDNLKTKRKQEVLNRGLTAIRDVDKWTESVDKFLEQHETSQTYKQLIGREEEFRQFAMKASHRGVGFEYLVPSFLFQVKEVAKKKGSLLLHGGGGQPPKGGPADVITDAAEAKRLRETNPLEYRRKQRAGKIKLSVE